MTKRTHAIHGDLDPRAHDLVPPIDTPDQPSRAVEAAGAAERVAERRVGGEVAFDRCSLG